MSFPSPLPSLFFVPHHITSADEVYCSTVKAEEQHQQKLHHSLQLLPLPLQKKKNQDPPSSSAEAVEEAFSALYRKLYFPFLAAAAAAADAVHMDLQKKSNLHSQYHYSSSMMMFLPFLRSGIGVRLIVLHGLLRLIAAVVAADVAVTVEKKMPTVPVLVPVDVPVLVLVGPAVTTHQSPTPEPSPQHPLTSPPQKN